MSLPCMNKKSGAAGKKTIAVPIIAPVMAPVWPPPFASFTARNAAFSPSTSPHVINIHVELPTAGHSTFVLRLGTVANAGPPRGTTITSFTLISSRTSKSTRSPVVESAEDRLRVRRSLIGAPSSRPNGTGCFRDTVSVFGGGCWSLLSCGACGNSAKLLVAGPDHITEGSEPG
jgi:hypothetical protein